ncbi:MAG: thiol peroxidase [Caldilineales bacterium]|nr:thiol peroxidase [Caldilineales bacterium]
MSERIVLLKGKPFSPLLGEEVTVGQKAPAAAGRTGGFSTNTFDVIKDTEGKVRVLNFIPSLNTGLCDAQTRRFNEDMAGHDNVVVVTISADLPFVQSNWCATSGLENAIMVSDAFNMAIADAYGTHIQDIRLDQRAVVVVDAEGVVRYKEYCPAIDMHPDFDAVHAAVHALV